MGSTLLINHIEVGKIEFEDELIIPKLNTFIKGDDYTVLMTKFNYNYFYNSFYVVYVLTQYNKDKSMEENVFQFNSQNEINLEDYKEYYQLDEITE